MKVFGAGGFFSFSSRREEERGSNPVQAVAYPILRVISENATLSSKNVEDVEGRFLKRYGFSVYESVHIPKNSWIHCL